MKRMVKSFLQRLGRLMAGPLRDAFLEDSPGGLPGQTFVLQQKAAVSLNRMLQLQLMSSYRNQFGKGWQPGFLDVGFDVFSPTYEDGILLYIFSVINMTDRRCVDIGAAGVDGSNTANLIINHGFNALLIDGSSDSVRTAMEFYAANPLTKLFPPKAVQAFVTAENINGILRDNGFTGDIDLLCIDIDGNDYWIWKAIDVIMPRVVVIEYQDILGPERSWTIPYRADFNRNDYDVNQQHTNYVGASLKALAKLASSKGYRLVGCNRGGWNAFFVKNPLGKDVLPEVSVESCFVYEWNDYGMEHRFPLVQDMPWQEV